MGKKRFIFGGDAWKKPKKTKKRKEKQHSHSHYLKPLVESIRDPKILAADLHVHTRTSADSKLTPVDALHIFSESGFPHIVGFSDHESVTWLLTSVVDNVSITPAMEVTVSYTLDGDTNERWAHVLAVGFDPSDEEIREGLCALAHARKKILRAIIRELRRYGIRVKPIKVDGMTPSAVIGEIAKCAVAHSFHKVLKMLRLKDGQISEQKVEGRLFHLLRGRVKDLVKLARWPLEDFIEKVHRAGGIVIIAHPVASRVKLEYSVFAQFAEMGVDGIEILHPSIVYSPEKAKLIDELVGKVKIGVTMGSDFHGLYDTCESNLLEYAYTFEKLKEFRTEVLRNW